MTTVWIAGVGLVAPGLASWSDARAVLTGAEPWVLTEASLPAPTILSKNERRRASPTIRLALEAAQQAVAGSGFEASELANVFGTSTADGDVLDTMLGAVTTPEGRVSPTMFHNSVHNAAAGYWSIATGVRAPSISIGAYDGTVAATLFAAAAAAVARRVPVLACVYDAVMPPTLRRLRDITQPFASALVLCPERPSTAIARLAVRMGARSAATAVTSPELEMLVRANPAARILPLLEAIARGQSAEIVIDWDDAPPLIAEVAPVG
jgi:hypothetical protein